ncbi:hypothetical protein NGA_0649600 [Nannochloropsis gaditana CCMP526]|uniref:uncharacterized protein n=1 Tax=Nannochloropsis gaditana (strain CCMP526) TaxID=1093141 RepID=UPI00029F60E3|nr:hypothetical protein NGA_0649600 [Nannochloropsis gaditana CCMP526]EKU20692.1 hypothetical protein NGA_0649600 [Nannochloropsis gaditana CCMP526]|eukprot:XP_005855674.1 hypothetical protein NGA_0649600 [Nannochloropsis gaditana CCMP526]
MDPGVAGHLIGQGAALGVIHVLSGPDHISALAALTATVPPYKAFMAGVQWGLGHSTGLIIVTGIFVSVEHEVMDRVAGYFDMDHVESLPSPQGLPGRLNTAGEGEFLCFPRPAAVW